MKRKERVFWRLIFILSLLALATLAANAATNNLSDYYDMQQEQQRQLENGPRADSALIAQEGPCNIEQIPGYIKPGVFLFPDVRHAFAL